MRYNEGSTGYRLVDLLHITGVLTPKSYKILGSNTIQNNIARMKKEGVLIKVLNGSVFETFDMDNYEKNSEELFELPYVDYEYFKRFGMSDMKRAKNSRGKHIGDAKRVIQSAEVTTLMYGAGIPTLPSQKEHVTESGKLKGNVYYQAREIKYYSGYKDKVDEENNILITTRINGTLLSEAGNYCVYHTGKEMKLWTSEGEYRLKSMIENMLASYVDKDGTCRLDNAILLSYKMSLFESVISPDKPLDKKFGILASVFKSIYALPYDENGRDMIKVMTVKDWDYHMRRIVTGFEEPEQDMSMVADYYQEDTGTYILVFCVPDIAKLYKFIKAARREISDGKKNRKNFLIYCFDYQTQLLDATVKPYAKIRQVSFRDFYENRWADTMANIEYYNKTLQESDKK